MLWLLQFKIIVKKFKQFHKKWLLFWNIIYPVGSYYETSDTTFSPNTEWGGTWVQDTKGLVTVGAIEDGGDNPAYGTLKLSVNDVQGEAEHTLTTDEMPRHNHETGVGVWANTQGGFMNRYPENTGNFCGSINTIDYTGGGLSHNNVQPSIGVKRWHRIA